MLDGLFKGVAKALADLGADVLSTTAGEDDSLIAAEANRYVGDLFLGVRFGDTPGCSCDFFASKAFRSEAGYLVARFVLEELSAVLEVTPKEPAGRMYAVLRETRMPAVVCQPTDGEAFGQAILEAIGDTPLVRLPHVGAGVEPQRDGRGGQAGRGGRAGRDVGGVAGGVCGSAGGVGEVVAVHGECDGQFAGADASAGQFHRLGND